MNRLRRVYQGIAGKPGKTCSMAIVILLAGLTAILYAYLGQINREYQEYFAEQYGTTIFLEAKEGKKIPADAEGRIQSLKHVTGCSNVKEMQRYIIIYVDDWKALKTVQKELKSRLGLQETCQWFSSADNAAEGLSGVAGLFMKIIPILGGGILVSVLAITFLMILLWVRAYYEEMGIYIALGLPERAVAGDMVLRMFFVAVAALLPAAVIAAAGVRYVGRQVLLGLTTVFRLDVYSPVQEADYRILNAGADMGSWFWAAIAGVVLFACLCALLAAGSVCRRGTRHLFDTRL